MQEKIHFPGSIKRIKNHLDIKVRCILQIWGFVWQQLIFEAFKMEMEGEREGWREGWRKRVSVCACECVCECALVCVCECVCDCTLTHKQTDKEQEEQFSLLKHI